MLFSGTKVERIVIEGGRATGILARTKGGRQIRVRARAVVVAAGSIPTPALLLDQGICNRSEQVGRNLTSRKGTRVTSFFATGSSSARRSPRTTSPLSFSRSPGAV
jgi:choline dehydrogenase-like flavoprotein